MILVVLYVCRRELIAWIGRRRVKLFPVQSQQSSSLCCWVRSRCVWTCLAGGNRKGPNFRGPRKTWKQAQQSVRSFAAPSATGHGCYDVPFARGQAARGVVCGCGGPREGTRKWAPARLGDVLATGSSCQLRRGQALNGEVHSRQSQANGASLFRRRLCLFFSSVFFTFFCLSFPSRQRVVSNPSCSYRTLFPVFRQKPSLVLSLTLLWFLFLAALTNPSSLHPSSLCSPPPPGQHSTAPAKYHHRFLRSPKPSIDTFLCVCASIEGVFL